MSNVIQLLEKIGQDSKLRYANKDSLSELTKELDCDQRAAILTNDQQSLKEQLGVEGKLVCLVLLSEDDKQADLPAVSNS